MNNAKQYLKISYLVALSIMLVTTPSANIFAKKRRKSKSTVHTKRRIGKIIDASIGLGRVTTPSGLYQTDIQGSLNKKNTSPFLVGMIDVNLYKSLSLAPELGIYVPETSRDKNISKLSYYLLAPFKMRFRNFFIHQGVGISYTKTSSKGGTQTLNNGTSTQDFPMPEVSSISSNIILSSGISYKFGKYISIKAQSFVFNIHEKETRIFHHTLSAHYHFAKIFK